MHVMLLQPEKRVCDIAPILVRFLRGAMDRVVPHRDL